MRSIDYSQCQPRAKALAERLHNSGKKVVLCWGAFKPTTPITSWDERWQERIKKYPKSMSEVVHFWVECDGLILDRSLMQFGYSEDNNIALTDDSRYEKFGYETLEGVRVKYPNSPHVVWDAFPEFEGN